MDNQQNNSGGGNPSDTTQPTPVQDAPIQGIPAQEAPVQDVNLGGGIAPQGEVAPQPEQPVSPVIPGEAPVTDAGVQLGGQAEPSATEPENGTGEQGGSAPLV